MLKRLSFLLLTFSGLLLAQPSVRVIPDQLYFSTLMNLLCGAQNRIDILQFSFAIGDEKGKLFTKSQPYQIAERLVELKKSNPNLQIRLYIESERNTATRNKVTAEFLRKGGIEVKEGKTHAKGFAIDGSTLLIGSTNLTIQSLEKNNETNLLLNEHPQLVRAYRTYFEKLWQDTVREPIASSAVNGIQLLTDGKYKEALLKAINEAKKTLDFSIYYFNDSQIERALIEAHRRGVAVRGYLNQHKTFALDLVERNRRTVDRLRAAGLKDIYFDLDTFFSHSKYLIADNELLLLGTGNWNRSDFEEHPQLYLSVKERAPAEKLSRHLSHQIAYESDRPAAPRLYYRFWTGKKKQGLETSEFDEAIRETFVRATVKTGEVGGLVGYLPVLLAKTDKTTQVPDEMALVIYQDIPTYRALREGAVGAVYGPLHFDYFDQSAKSTVPEPYTGTVKLNAAYDLSAGNVDWQDGEVLVAFTPSKGKAVDLKGVENYFNRLPSVFGQLRVDGYLVLVGEDYLIEYFHRSSDWKENDWLKIRTLQYQTLNGSYPTATQVETAYSATFEQNQITRPTRFPLASFKRNRMSGVLNTEFDHKIKGEQLLASSLASFALTDEQSNELRDSIKEAFVRRLPVPERDVSIEEALDLGNDLYNVQSCGLGETTAVIPTPTSITKLNSNPSEEVIEAWNLP